MVNGRQTIRGPILPKIKVSTEGEFPELFHVEMDGKELKTVKNLNISIGAGKIPVVTIELYASIDFAGKIYPMNE